MYALLIDYNYQREDIRSSEKENGAERMLKSEQNDNKKMFFYTELIKH